MRFPDLLVEVQELADRLTMIRQDVDYALTEVAKVKHALKSALPEAAQYFRDEVSRETR